MPHVRFQFLNFLSSIFFFGICVLVSRRKAASSPLSSKTTSETKVYTPYVLRAENACFFFKWRHGILDLGGSTIDGTFYGLKNTWAVRIDGTRSNTSGASEIQRFDEYDSRCVNLRFYYGHGIYLWWWRWWRKSYTINSIVHLTCAHLFSAFLHGSIFFLIAFFFWVCAHVISRIYKWEFQGG